ncbi:dihydrofolate reductase family protein [Larkinella soli]|uniref:dihydrofolate reductase family protein n=1 Tax=Larkinella soli TaxID=1770527 RepID=UPI000FFC016F|nr:dihydrofolate reductase family protein [Larkinella soli]
MRKVKLFIATSLDFYIAGPNGEIDWLLAEGDYGYGKFMETVDTTLMGYETYKLTESFGDFPYKDTRNFVFTRRTDRPQAPYVEFVSGEIAGFVKNLKEQSGKDLFLVGGGQINALLLEAGLIDEIRVFIHPILLGEGIPMIQPTHRRQSFRFVRSHAFENGLVELHYEKLPEN